MALPVRGALVVMLVAVSVLSGCVASGSSSESAAALDRNAAEEKAWDELSSILTDLSLLNNRFDHTLKLTRDIGANMSVSSLVPYDDYEKLSARLKVWRNASSAEYPAYWEELASAALEMTETLVKYAYDGDAYLLADAEDAHKRLNATLDEHCDQPDYSPFIEYCK